jgi:hypothetical protein
MKILDDYSLVGWPNHFFTLKANNKYNEKIEKYARKCTQDDLSIFQKIKLFFYVRYLDCYDLIIFSSEKRQKKNKDNKEGE